MASSLFRILSTSAITHYNNTTNHLRSVHTATVFYAARKGTRAKARAKKVKVEITKVGFIPHNQRGKDRVVKMNINKHLDDSFKQISQDDVYPMKYFRWPVYTAEEAVNAHKETHHPSMYNVPNAFVFAKVELNMEAAKKNRYMDSFTKLTLLPHSFTRDEERTVLAFCKSSEMAKEALDAGATTAGGVEIIKKIQEGVLKLSEYDYIVAHPNIITELVPIRGLMKRRFPSMKAGTLEQNISALVKKLAGGIQFRVVKDEQQQNHGSVEIPIGRLNMESKQVAENIEAFLKDIQALRPKRDGLFITRCMILSPPSTERLKIDPFVYVDREIPREVEDDSDDEEEVAKAIV